MRSEELRIVPLVGRQTDWNALIQKAFSDGANAVLALGEGVTPADGALAALCEVRSTNRQAVLGGTICDAESPHFVEHAGYWWADATLEWRRERYIEFVSDRLTTAPRTTDWLCGSALLIPDDAWRTIGGFDHRFGSFLADIDWCLRARNAGFQCLNVHNARFASTRASEAFDIRTESARWRSTLMLARKHSVPCGLLALAIRQILAQMGAELERVDFWADYGARIGFMRRTLWFLRHASQALQRERLRTKVRQTVRDTCSLLLRNDLHDVG
jgi:GT2 family glycosyltransferase